MPGDENVVCTATLCLSPNASLLLGTRSAALWISNHGHGVRVHAIMAWENEAQCNMVGRVCTPGGRGDCTRSWARAASAGVLVVIPEYPSIRTSTTYVVLIVLMVLLLVVHNHSTLVLCTTSKENMELCSVKH